MRLKHAVVPLTLAVLCSCSHDIASPSVTADKVKPDLVCNQQLTTRVQLSGEGFTPMPSGTYAGARLLFPAVKLSQTRTLGGAAASGEVAIPDDPAAPEASLLHWTSEQLLSFDVTPALALQPGFYDITVTNPDGKTAATFSSGLAAVPAPVLLSADHTLFCDAQSSRTVQLTGTGFLTVGGAVPNVKIGSRGNQDFTSVVATGCTALSGTFAEGAVSTCTGLTVVLPTGLFPPGDYGVSVTNPVPAACATSESLNLRIVPPPTLSGTDRAGLCDAQGAQTLKLTGTDFLRIGQTLPTVHIGSKSNADFTSIEATGCTATGWTIAEGPVSSCTGLIVVLPQGLLAAGTYPVSVENPLPAGCSSTQTIELKVEPPPVVTSTVPASICTGGGNLTVNGENFVPGASVSLVDPSGAKAPVASTTTDVNAAGTSLTATFLAGGSLDAVFDVVVDNNDGCTDVAPHKTLTVVAGPVAFFADPEVVYNGIATRVTVYVTKLVWPAAGNLTARLIPHGAAGPVIPLDGLPVPGHPNRVQVIIPAGQAPGAYDLSVADSTGCPATLDSAITVTDSTSIALKSVTPPFAYSGSATAVVVKRDTAAGVGSAEPFVATPRLFLNPFGASNTDVAIQLQSVSFVDADTLTAVVPANQPARRYELVVVNPNGKVGVLPLPAFFEVMASPPPVVNSVTPASLLNTGTNTLKIAGTNFSAGATASLSCRSGGGAGTSHTVTLAGNPSCSAGACTVSGSVSGLANGATCVVRLTNADGSYSDFSAVGVTDTPGNLSSQAAGQALGKGRRAPVAAAGDATGAARFVYAIGGDGGSGSAGAPFADIEVASVDPFGTMGSWRPAQRSSLGTARAFAGSSTVGRYVYVHGGSDGTAALASAERAMILDPSEVPHLDIADLVPANTGLDPGIWLYRVSAVYADADPDNPGGESLPSEEVIVRVPAFAGHKIQVLLAWSHPVDSLGAALPNVVGYDIYRTPAVNGGSGGEVLMTTVGASVLTWTDDGTASAQTPSQSPLPLGSLGKWTQLPNLGTARKGHAAAAAFDPSVAGRFYLYALGGASATNGMLSSYEFLPVTINPNGHQTVGTAWTAGQRSLSAGRWQIGAWVADQTVSSSIAAGTSYVYVGGGLGSTGPATFVHNVDAGQVATGGDLGTFSAMDQFGSDLAGYSANTAAGTLFAWGGSGAVPASDGHSAVISGTPPALTAGAWNSVGGINLGSGRYLAGSTVQSAFFFVVGGANNGAGADNTTLLMVW